MKVELTIKGNIPKPKVGERYMDMGLCGRVGWYEYDIIKVTKTHIHLRDDGHGIIKKNKKTKVPLAEYFYKKLTNSDKAEYVLKLNGKVKRLK